MPRRNDERIVFDDGEDEDREDPVTIKDGCGEEEDEDDEEANEDLSLKILEKALSRRGFDDSKEKSMSDLCGSGVVGTVMINGGKSKGKNAESSKKMRRTKLEAAHEISIISKEEKVVEDALKGEEDERSAEPSSNMVLKKLLRGARYFDPPDAGWVSCYSCGEQGHITVNCPTPTKRRKPCFICGSLEHGAKQCSKGQDCYICKKGGHRAKDCPDKYKSGSKTAVCLRCGDFGHEMILCKYEYSQDDLKDIQCYVCKSFGHLCCVESGNSPSWAVSCYRCGQLGHTGLACGRHYDESTEKDSSCFKCGGEGHLKRDCPNSSSVSFPENSRELASACFKCGEEGHFSRECPNSSSISISQGRDSPSLCYRCNGAGHFARECPNSSQVSSKRNRETSTPSHKSRKKNKENSEHSSTPHEYKSNGKTKKKKTHKGEEPQTTPRKPKHRGGSKEDYFQREVRSPITPRGHNNHNHRLPSSPMGHNHRLQAFNSGGHFQSYGRNHRNSSFESNPSRWQPYYPPNSHQIQRYAPAHSRYGPAHHYGDDFAGNYGPW